MSLGFNSLVKLISWLSNDAISRVKSIQSSLFLIRTKRPTDKMILYVETTQANLTPSDPIGIRRNPWYRILTESCRMSENARISEFLQDTGLFRQLPTNSYRIGSDKIR